MTYGVRLHIWGERALFTRPEMKVERVSYDVITPSAARGILEAIHWKPAIRWVVDSIQVLRPIRFESIRRNEVGGKLSAAAVGKAMKAGRTDGLVAYVEEDRQQRAATLLREVGYVISAHSSSPPRRARTTASASIWTSSTGARDVGSASRRLAWARGSFPPASPWSRRARSRPNRPTSCAASATWAGCCTTSTSPTA